MENRFEFIPTALIVNGKTFPASYENLPGRVVIVAEVQENGKKAFKKIEVPETDINYLLAYAVADETARKAAEPAPETSAPETSAESVPDPEERPETISPAETDEEKENETMKPETVKIPETISADDFADRILSRLDLEKVRPEWRKSISLRVIEFYRQYGRLYAADENGETIDYTEETALFDAWMAVDLMKEYVSEFCAARRDFIASDREAAAFVLACEVCNKAEADYNPLDAIFPAKAEETERPETISAEETSAPDRAPIDKPARGPAKPKEFAGEALSGKGWSIVFDTGLNRTRVIVADPLREKLAPMIENAGFFFSKSQNSWNKKLTHKAHRAAIALADNIRTALAS